jgi:hypothetical protein
LGFFTGVIVRRFDFFFFKGGNSCLSSPVLLIYLSSYVGVYLFKSILMVSNLSFKFKGLTLTVDYSEKVDNFF